VDAGLRTSVPGVFAAGNLLHPVDTADVAALDGSHVAESIRRWLDDGAVRCGLHLVPEPPLRWLSPQYVEPGGAAPARHRLLSWTESLVRRPVVEARQEGGVVGRVRPWWPAAPGRVFRIPSGLLDGVDPDGGDVTIRLA
jgi:hypothetical protein